jgi:hypothetical protein
MELVHKMSFFHSQDCHVKLSVRIKSTTLCARAINHYLCSYINIGSVYVIIPTHPFQWLENDSSGII